MEAEEGREGGRLFVRRIDNDRNSSDRVNGAVII